MRFKKIIKLFEDGNVSVSGLCGRGKDMLMANVAVRRQKPYVANCPYSDDALPFDLDKITIGYNTYENFLSGKIRRYEFPYVDGTDFYLSDCGVYFPSQYCNELNKKYPYVPGFMALTRQLGECNFHYNVQNLNRCWDKIREQSDTYICCRGCVVIFGIVFQRVRIYTQYDAAAKQVPPFPVRKPFLNSDRRLWWELSYSNYLCTHGEIKSGFLIYRNKSTYNTRIFKQILEGGTYVPKDTGRS